MSQTTSSLTQYYFSGVFNLQVTCLLETLCGLYTILLKGGHYIVSHAEEPQFEGAQEIDIQAFLTLALGGGDIRSHTSVLPQKFCSQCCRLLGFVTVVSEVCYTYHPVSLKMPLLLHAY
jgi:hypothetical protein